MSLADCGGMELPRGTVTFLFTDIEASTRLLTSDPAGYPAVVAAQRALIRDAAHHHGGVVFGHEGDACFVAFADASEAVTAAAAAQRALSRHAWSGGRRAAVRFGLHTGTARVSDGDYYGITVHTAARVAAAAHGGQVLLSDATRLAGEVHRARCQDLGEHLLRDIDEPVRLFQLEGDGLATAFPPPRTLAAPGSPATAPVRLPPEPTPFIGRSSELGVLTQLLRDPTARLVTILGPGGIGKTRLSIVAARRTADLFPDGVFFVPLAPVASVDRVAEAVAESIGFVGDPQSDLDSQLRAHLAQQVVLLVLDNVEHLQPTDFVAMLLDAAPGVRLLATSRERLGLRSERVFELGGMGWSPRRGSAAGGGAVDLFVHAARNAASDVVFDDRSLEVVRRICGLVGGMPLAVELAAGWSGVLSPEGIAAEIEQGLEILATDLRDVPARHRSIRAVCDASLARLAPADRDVFTKLSVFVDGFSLAAARDVTGVTLQSLRRLVATSMVTAVGGDRYRIHEVLRQYGADALADAGRLAAVRHSHSEHYVGWLARTSSALKGGAQRVAVGQVSAEISNIRAAWSDAARHGRRAAIEAGIEALWLYFDARGSSGAMAPMIDEALRAFHSGDAAAAESVGNGAIGPRLRAARGIALAERGELGEGCQALRASVAELDVDEDGDERAGRGWSALAHLWLAWVEFLLARNADAERHAARSLRLYEADGDRWGVARCQFLIGNNDTAVGRLVSAERALTSCRSLADAIGDARGASLARRNLSILAGWFGDFDAARSSLADVVDACRTSGDRLGLAYALREIGKIEVAKGRPADAVATCEQSIAITDELENDWESAATRNDLGNALAALGELDAADREIRRCLEAADAAGNRYYIARCVGDLGALAVRRGHADRARRQLGRAQRMWEDIGHEPYLCWVLIQLASVAGAEPSGAIDATPLHAHALALAINNRLAPFALEIVVATAELDGPPLADPIAERVRNVVGHPAATRAVSDRAVALLSASNRPATVRPGSTAPGWQATAEAVAADLAARAAQDPRSTRH
jgi:predicted ATPase/class 3 adenylate cyclase